MSGVQADEFVGRSGLLRLGAVRTSAARDQEVFFRSDQNKPVVVQNVRSLTSLNRSCLSASAPKLPAGNAPHDGH